MPRRKRTSRRSSAKAGLPPGSLVLIGNEREDPVTIEMIDYAKDQFSESQVDDMAELAVSLDQGGITWVNINGIHNTEAIGAIGQMFDVHKLVLEDILNTEHRPKVELFENHVFFTLKMIWYNEEAELEREQISIIFGRYYVLCFQERKGDIFDPIRERLRSDSGLIRKKGSDYLVYRLIDTVVDNYFLVIEKIEEKVEEMEDLITGGSELDVTRDIQFLKREIIGLRRSLLPLREAVSGLEKGVSDLVDPDNAKYFHDVYDHLLHISEGLETNREVLSGLMDMHLANMSNRMNEVMKVLTIIATIFIPLTFLAGIYGMNFENMPELKWEYSYYVLLGIMLVLFVLMLLYFKRKKWF